MKRTITLGMLVLMCALLELVGSAADLSGSYIAQLTGGAAAPQYARVTLKLNGTRISGSWGPFILDGALNGTRIELKLAESSGKSAGELSGAVSGDGFTGEGRIAPAGPNFGGGGRGASTEPQPVTWKLTAYRPPDKPKTYDFEPTSFYSIYSANWTPVLHIYPGDTVRTRTIDNARDAKAVRYGSGGDPSTGPFYIEGALPGDTLVVHLVEVRANKLTAQQGSRINAHAVTPAYFAAAKYEPGFNTEWTLDMQKGIATMTHPTDRMKGFTVPIKTMLGCVSVAPAAEEQFRGTDLGPFGGNLDYNDNVEGTTLYFPVSHPGALFGIGDAHAAMGDGELTGAALETSADVAFTVDVIKGEQTPQVRAETKDYLISFGVAGSVADSIEASTTQLVNWLKKDYGMNDSEVAVFLGAVLKYDITELVDPHYDVVAKVPKSALVSFRKVSGPEK
jgi:acetamidase/formamidase